MRSHYFPRGLKFALFAVLFVAVLAALGFVVMGLWNWLTPALFGWKLINYWQALGLIILSKILFGGFAGSGGRSEYWRYRMMKRWEQMTPEEREKFRQGFRGRCGPFEPPSAEPTA